MRWALLSTLLLALTLLASCGRIPSIAQVRKDHPSSFREILDEKGELIHETRVDFKTHRRGWMSFEEIPRSFLEELIYFEDKRFHTHPGLDPLAVLSALRSYPFRGASTISMQLANLLKVSEGRGITRKGSQALAALRINSSWKKEDVLEAYVNLLPFRGELQGLRAASLGLFAKEPQGLNQWERMLLISLIPSPNQSEERLLLRACSYLRRYHQDASADCQGIRLALESSYFHRPLFEQRENIAHHISALSDKHQERVKTTIQKDLQKKAQELLSYQLSLLEEQNVSDGAILIVERKSAKILAYVGSAGPRSAAWQIDHVRTPRQAGSTLKPLLFAQAISEKLLTMSSPIKDEPFTITRDGLTYQPENYNQSFTHKAVPLKVALGSSLNIPAVKVIDLVSPDKFYELLKLLEFRNLKASDYYGHSMALGAVDITLWDLVRSYHALAEKGELRELSFVGEGKKLKDIPEFSPAISFIISNILAEKNNRALTFGIQSALTTNSWSAVKTGTSKDMRDNWCVGYTDKYVIGIWIGNSSGSPMWNVTGISGAAPIFNHLVNYLHLASVSHAPVVPEGVVAVANNFYLPGTEPKGKVDPAARHQITRIILPQHGSQFAFDPEIPGSNQRIKFVSSTPGKWILNGRRLSDQEAQKGLLPDKKGRYQLELWEDEKTKKDEVTFYVKAGKPL